MVRLVGSVTQCSHVKWGHPLCSPLNVKAGNCQLGVDPIRSPFSPLPWERLPVTVWGSLYNFLGFLTF